MNPPMILPVMTAVILLETERGAVDIHESCVVAVARISVLMSLCVVVGGDSVISGTVVVVGGGGGNEDNVVLACVTVTVVVVAAAG